MSFGHVWGTSVSRQKRRVIDFALYRWGETTSLWALTVRRLARLPTRHATVLNPFCKNIQWQCLPLCARTLTLTYVSYQHWCVAVSKKLHNASKGQYNRVQHFFSLLFYQITQSQSQLPSSIVLLTVTMPDSSDKQQQSIWNTIEMEQKSEV